MAKKRVNLSLSKDILDKAKNQAEKEGISLSAFISNLINNYIRRNK